MHTEAASGWECWGRKGRLRALGEQQVGPGPFGGSRVSFGRPWDTLQGFSTWDRIRQRGWARFREFPPLILPLELSISPARTHEDNLSPAEVMCGGTNRSSHHHTPQVWGRQGKVSPQKPLPLAVLSVSLHCPLPPATSVPLCHPGSVPHSSHPGIHLDQL